MRTMRHVCVYSLKRNSFTDFIATMYQNLRADFVTVPPLACMAHKCVTTGTDVAVNNFRGISALCMDNQGSDLYNNIILYHISLCRRSSAINSATTTTTATSNYCCAVRCDAHISKQFLHTNAISKYLSSGRENIKYIYSFAHVIYADYLNFLYANLWHITVELRIMLFLLFTFPLARLASSFCHLFRRMLAACLHDSLLVSLSFIQFFHIILLSFASNIVIAFNTRRKKTLTHTHNFGKHPFSVNGISPRVDKYVRKPKNEMASESSKTLLIHTTRTKRRELQKKTIIIIQCSHRQND